VTTPGIFKKNNRGLAPGRGAWHDGRNGHGPFLSGVNQAEGLVPSSQRARGEL
jgi:hypothetical protein